MAPSAGDPVVTRADVRPALSLLACGLATFLVIGGLLALMVGTAVVEVLVLLLAAAVLVALAAVLGRECGVCCETRRLRS